MTTSIEDKLKKIYDNFFLYKNKINNINRNNNDVEKKLKYLYDEFIKRKSSSSDLVRINPVGPVVTVNPVGPVVPVNPVGPVVPVNPAGPTGTVNHQTIQAPSGDVDILSSTINFTKNGDKLESNQQTTEETVLTLDDEKRNVIQKYVVSLV